jgi:hypothetical protein
MKCLVHVNGRNYGESKKGEPMNCASAYANRKCRCSACTEFRSLRSSWQRRILRRLREFSGCLECGYNTNGAALDYHHIDPSTKNSQVDPTLLSWENTFDEMAKCVVLCKNCHAIHHLEEN